MKTKKRGLKILINIFQLIITQEKFAIIVVLIRIS